MKFHIPLRPIAVAIGLCSALAASAVECPDIVIFLADDLTVDDLTIYGGKGIPTPNSDRIAQEGMTFDRAYVTSPSCAPSRAALLTGRFAANTGAIFNHQKVQDGIARWPSYFRKLGYEVVAFGKVSHYNHVLDYGFDQAEFFGYHEDICVAKAVEWLDARKSNKPLCFFVGTNWPHVPWPQREARAPESVDLRHKLADTPQTRKAVARYETAVKRMDRDLGEVWDAMRRRLPKDTFFLFTADHGAQFPFEKWNLYEPSLRTPLVVVWPGHVKPDSRSEALVSWVDILPTVLEIAGESAKTVSSEFDGRSFLPVLLGKTDAHRNSVFASHSGDGKMNFYPSRAVVDRRWKYIRNLDPNLEFHTHIDRAHQDTGYWPSWVEKAKTDPTTAELVEKYHKRPPEELYDLEQDPGERNNLAGSPDGASELQRMRRELDVWMRDLGDRGMATDEAARPSGAR